MRLMADARRSDTTRGHEAAAVVECTGRSSNGGAFRGGIRGSQRSCRAIAGVLRRPWASRLLLAALARRPALGNPVIRRLHSGRGPARGAEQWL